MASWGIRGPTIRFSGDKTWSLPGVHNISPARRGRAGTPPQRSPSPGAAPTWRSPGPVQSVLADGPRLRAGASGCTSI